MISQSIRLKHLKYKKKYIITKNEPTLTYLNDNELGMIIGGTNNDLLTISELNKLYGNTYKFYELYQMQRSNIYSVMNYIYAKFGPFSHKINTNQILGRKISDADFYAQLRKYYTTNIDEINEFRRQTYRSKQINQKIKSIKQVINNNLMPFTCNKILDIGTEDVNYIVELENSLKCPVIGLNITSGYSHYVTYNEAVESGKIVLYDGINIPFDDNEFNLVTIISVLHHVIDIEHFMQEVCRVAKNIYIRDNDMSTITSRYIVDIQHELYEGVLYPGLRSPLYNTTNDQIIKYLTNNNFKIVYNLVETYFTRPYTILASKIN